MSVKKVSLVALLLLCFLVVFQSIPAEAGEISKDARKHMYRGQAAMEVAKDAADFHDAVKEFKAALRHAPKWADAWFNLGVAQEKTADYGNAVTSFRKYLKLSPNATDREQVEGRIFKLEYKQEKQTQRAAEKTKERESISFAGDWCHEMTEYLRCEPTRIEMSGSQIEIIKYYKPDGYYWNTPQWATCFRGTVKGNTISGYYYPEPVPCPNMRSSASGTVVNKNKIVLNVQGIHSWYGPDAQSASKRCTVEQFKRDKLILNRK